MADFSGGGAHGFAVAYLGVALLMLLALPAALALRRDTHAPLTARPAA